MHAKVPLYSRQPVTHVFPKSVDIRNTASLLSGILKMFSCQKCVPFFLEIKNHRCKVIMLRLQMAARAHWVLGLPIILV